MQVTWPYPVNAVVSTTGQLPPVGSSLPPGGYYMWGWDGNGANPGENGPGNALFYIPGTDYSPAAWAAGRNVGSAAEAERVISVLAASGSWIGRPGTQYAGGKVNGPKGPLVYGSNSNTGGGMGIGDGSGNGGVEIGINDLIDLVSAGLPAIQPVPPAPKVVSGDSAANFANLVKYLEADAKYIKRDEQIRALGDGIKVFVTQTRMVGGKLMMRDLINVAGEALGAVQSLPPAPSVGGSSTDDQNWENVFKYLDAQAKHFKRDEQIRAGAQGLGLILQRLNIGA